MDDLFQSQDEQGWFGTFSNEMGPVSEMEGRMGGGGWIDDPMGLSVKDGKGFWRPAPGADGEQNVERIAVPDGGNGTAYGVEGTDMILDKVEGWDESYMKGRIG